MNAEFFKILGSSATTSNEGALVANIPSVQKQLHVTLPFGITKIKKIHFTSIKFGLWEQRNNP